MIQDILVLHLMATTSGVYMPEDFFEGIKGVRYSHYGQYISGYADTFEELLIVLNRHAQVGGERGLPGGGALPWRQGNC